MPSWSDPELLPEHSADVERNTPEDYLRRRELVRLLDALSEEQRTALVLHFVLELSVAEIAEQVGVPMETVRSRLRLGKARLRTLAGAAWDHLDPEREHEE